MTSRLCLVQCWGYWRVVSLPSPVKMQPTIGAFQSFPWLFFNLLRTIAWCCVPYHHLLHAHNAWLELNEPKVNCARSAKPQLFRFMVFASFRLSIFNYGVASFRFPIGINLCPLTHHIVPSQLIVFFSLFPNTVIAHFQRSVECVFWLLHLHLQWIFHLRVTVCSSVQALALTFYYYLF